MEIISFNPYNSQIKLVLLLFSFYRWVNWGLERTAWFDEWQNLSLSQICLIPELMFLATNLYCLNKESDHTIWNLILMMVIIHKIFILFYCKLDYKQENELPEMQEGDSFNKQNYCKNLDLFRILLLAIYTIKSYTKEQIIS